MSCFVASPLLLPPKVNRPKDPTDPQDPLPSSRGEGAELLVRDPSKAKAPATESRGKAIGPFILTQESDAFSEDVSFSSFADF